MPSLKTKLARPQADDGSGDAFAALFDGRTVLVAAAAAEEDEYHGRHSREHRSHGTAFQKCGGGRRVLPRKPRY
jgi:hypothetical protein